jgi:hypothetical protein
MGATLGWQAPAGPLTEAVHLYASVNRFSDRRVKSLATCMPLARKLPLVGLPQRGELAQRPRQLGWQSQRILG